VTAVNRVGGGVGVGASSSSSTTAVGGGGAGVQRPGGAVAGKRPPAVPVSLNKMMGE